MSNILIARKRIQLRQRKRNNRRRAKSIHNNKYDYSKTDFSSTRNRVTITCPIHGDFVQYLSSHINQGCGCAKCAHIIRSQKKRYNTEYLKDRFINRAKQIHGNKYDYSKLSYEGRNTSDPVCIICPVHGEFWQTYGNHITLKHNCPKCSFSKEGIKSKIDNMYGSSRQRRTEFLKLAKKEHGNKYEYPYLRKEFVNFVSKITVRCPDHGDIIQVAHNHMRGHGCSKCRRSGAEEKIERFVKREIKNNDLKYKVLSNNRHILSDKRELDIFVSGLKFAIEFGSNYMHSEDKVGKYYHKNKAQDCYDKNIELITFFDNEWNDIKKRKIIKSIIRHKLGTTRHKIYARNCSIRYIDTRYEKEFLNTNHVQGYSPSRIKLGLVHKNKLVALLTLGKPRFNNDYEWEIIRYCCKKNTVVTGGFSKLFKEFTISYQPKSVVTFADLRWGRGEVYNKNGFKFVNTTEPCPWYTNSYPNSPHYHRMKVQKHKLKKFLSNFDPNKTAKQNLIEHNFVTVYDCGHNKYVYERW